MRVLLLANHFDTGGITSYLSTLTGGLLKEGHDVFVASQGGDRVADIEKKGARHFFVRLRVKCEIHPFVFFSAFRLASFVRAERIDIIHAHTRSAQVCAAIVSCLTGVPFVSTCHGFFNPHVGRRLFPLWGKYVIAISAPVADHLRKDFVLPSQKIALVRNGISLDEFTPATQAQKQEARRAWGLGDGPVIGIVARLSDVKGHCYLIDAMEGVGREFPDAVCVIAGTGPMEETLKEQVRRKGLESRIRFLNVTNRTPEILRLLDIFVLPSLQEGLGLSVIEAAAGGIAAVASSVGGIPEVVRHGETGVLVPPGNVPALTEGILGLLRDPARRKMLGAQAREAAVERFSSEAMVAGTIEVYKKAFL